MRQKLVNSVLVQERHECLLMASQRSRPGAIVGERREG
jgi:hypothetical protein